MAKKKTEIIDFGMESTCLIGIQCPNLEDYRLAWSINQTLCIDLKKMTDLPHQLGNRQADFSFFYMKDKNEWLTYHLIENSSNKVTLFGNYHSYDYFLIINVENDRFDEERFLEKITKSELIFAAEIIETTKVKGFEELMYDLDEELIRSEKEQKKIHNEIRKSLSK